MLGYQQNCGLALVLCFALTPSPGFAAANSTPCLPKVLESLRTNTVAQQAWFQNWLKTTKNPYAKQAEIVAKKMTVEQAWFIRDSGGIQLFPAKQRCEHCCAGCLIRSGERRTAKVDWEEYKERFHALLGLEAAFTQGTGQPMTLYYRRKFLAQFFDSDPMSNLLHSKTGSPKTIYDMVKFFHDETGMPSQIVTSGWNPLSKYSEPAARAMVRDMVSRNADYLRGGKDFHLQIKFFTRRFREEFETFILKLMKEDPFFKNELADQVEQHGINFSEYTGSLELMRQADVRYRELAQKNLNTFITQSSYMQDRIANMKTVLPAVLAEKTDFAFYVSEDAKNTSVRFLAPILEQDAVVGAIDFINRKYFRNQLRFNRARPFDISDSSSFSIHKWAFGNTLDRPLKALEEGKTGSPVLLPNGAMTFSGTTQGSVMDALPNLVTNQNPVVRSFADNPIFAMSDEKPPRKIAQDRLDGTRFDDLPPVVLADVEDHVQELIHLKTGSEEPARIVVSERVDYQVNRKRKDPILYIEIDGTSYYFNFHDDSVYSLDHKVYLAP